MPITSDGLTPLLRRLKARIIAEGSFSCFAENVGVEETIKAYAAGRGVDACELMAAWAGTPGRMPVTGTKKRGAPSQPLESDDDDAGTECPDCGGSGFDSDGETCSTCGGSGRVDSEDGPDDDDDDGNNKIGGWDYGRFYEEE
jgi:hypothetical protein